MTTHTGDQLQVILVVRIAGAEAERIQPAQIPAGEQAAGFIGARAGVGIPPIEIRGAVAAAEQAETVQFHRVGQGHAGIEADALAVEFRLAPALHGIWYLQFRVGVLESDGVGPLARARSRVGLGQRAENRRLARLAKGKARLQVDLIALAIAFRILRVAHGDFRTGRIVENDVDHAGDGVGTVLRRGAVAQHFDALDGGHGNLRQVGRLRAARTQQGAAVETLAVNQHQGLVRRQAAQGGGTHEDLPVSHRQALHHVRGNQLRQHVVQIRRLDGADIFAVEDIHGRHGVELRTVAAARASDDHGLRGINSVAGGNGGSERIAMGLCLIGEHGGHGTHQGHRAGDAGTGVGHGEFTMQVGSTTTRHSKIRILHEISRSSAYLH
ncbi:hypothetical protein D3C72_907020 [compost metagenome]